MALTDQQQQELYDRIMGTTPGPYADEQRGLGGVRRRSPPVRPRRPGRQLHRVHAPDDRRQTGAVMDTRLIAIVAFIIAVLVLLILIL